MTKTIRVTKPEKAERLKNALLTASSDARKTRNLERVWCALESMREGGARDYRIPAVVRKLGAEGPAESTIRNKGGEAYRELISAYAEEVAPAKRSVVTGADEDLPLAIPDLAVAARVAAVLAQNRALKRRNDMLHEQFARLATNSSPGAARLSPPASLDTTPIYSITPEMVRAVRRFLGSISSMGWIIDEPTGAILDRNGSEIAPPYFVDALKLVVVQADRA